MARAVEVYGVSTVSGWFLREYLLRKPTFTGRKINKRKLELPTVAPLSVGFSRLEPLAPYFSAAPTDIDNYSHSSVGETLPRGRRP